MKIGTSPSPTTSSMLYHHRYPTIAPFFLQMIMARRSPSPFALNFLDQNAWFMGVVNGDINHAEPCQRLFQKLKKRAKI
jgi:hypothetical protein